MDLIGWLILGFLAGALSGLVVPRTAARGCVANILVGILGALVGGYLFRQLGLGDASGFIGAVIVAFVGAVVVRLIIAAVSGRERG